VLPPGSHRGEHVGETRVVSRTPPSPPEGFVGALVSAVAGTETMHVVHARCAGLDVQKRTVVACVLLTPPEGTVERDVRTFGTMTTELLALADWLTAREVTHVAMESTGV
jgi:hypothetical protein